MSEPAETSDPAPQQPSALVSNSQAAALDAVVLEDSQVPYAYSPQPSWQGKYPLPYQSQFPFQPPLPREKVYSVPKRFGLAALLALITALGCLFGALRLVETPPVIYLFLGLEVMAICVAQMFYNAEPRRASMIAGAILMPIFIAGAAFFHPYNGFAFALTVGILMGTYSSVYIASAVVVEWANRTNRKAKLIN